MARELNNSAASSTQNTDWKADAFINAYLPRPGKPNHKMGFFTLKLSKDFDAAMIKRLQEDPDALAAFKAMLVFDFRMSTQEEPTGAVLPF